LKKLTAADRGDTWDAGWEERLEACVRSAGHASLWRYLGTRPGVPYAELAEELATLGGFGVAPVQLERLQVRDTPDSELASALRDSLRRHLRHAFRAAAWGQGPYWQSRALGALVSWSSMWSARVDLTPAKQHLFELNPPVGWIPSSDQDRFLLAVIPLGNRRR